MSNELINICEAEYVREKAIVIATRAARHWEECCVNNKIVTCIAVGYLYGTPPNASSRKNNRLLANPANARCFADIY